MSAVYTPTLTLEHQVTAWLDEKFQWLEQYAQQRPIPRKAFASAADCAAALYDKLNASQFCRHRTTDREQFLATLLTAIGNDRPIPCILGHGPLKNPNNAASPLADWAEFLTYCQLMKLAAAVQAIYEPGLSVSLYLDDGRAQYANNVSPHLTQTYAESIQTLIRHFPFQQVIHNVVPLKANFEDERFWQGFSGAEAAIRNHLCQPCGQTLLDELCVHATRNLPPGAISQEANGQEANGQETNGQETNGTNDAFIREATLRYLIYLEAEKRRGIWDQPDTLYMRYSHHEGFYQLFTLRKGSVTQPWQGEGCLALTPAGKLDPTVLTRQKRATMTLNARYTIPRTVDIPGLETIAVFSEARP